MPLPLVIAYHLVWTAYGWWLPNDVRGSMSRALCCDVLKDLAELHYGRKRVQPTSRELRTFFGRAHARLKYPATEFTYADVIVIGAAFQRAIETFRYTCYACAIMPDHVHLLVRKHRDSAEMMVANLQRESHLALREAGRFDLEHPVWGGHGCSVFLDSPHDIWRTIPYIENNPVKIRRPRQQWDFVKEYGGWPLHPGHNPNSPYARRLRATGRY